MKQENFIFGDQESYLDSTDHYNFASCLVNAANECPEKVAFIFQEGTTQKSITYHQLHLHALNVSVELRKTVAMGERALLVYPPGLDYIIGFMGCLYAGVIAVPVYPPATANAAEKLRTIVDNCTPAIILTDNVTNRRLSQLKYAGMAANIPVAGRFVSSLMRVSNQELKTMNDSLALDIPFLVTDTLPFSEEKLSNRSIVRTYQDSLAFLQYTSGSTGNPKGVMVSHNNLRHSTSQYGAKFSMMRKRMVYWLPPYHDLGLIGGILTPIFYQCETFLFSPIEFLRNPLKWMIVLSEFKANISAAPNFAYGLITKRYDQKKLIELDLSAIELLLVGAEPVKSHTMQQFAETYAKHGLNKSSITPGYGIAEGTLIITGKQKSDPFLNLNLLKNSYSKGSIVEVDFSEEGLPVVGCGSAFPGHEVAIVHPETLEKTIEGQIGEVWIKSDSVAKGYWHNPELTAQVFHAMTVVGEGPYLRTGDLGFMYKEQLFISGRLKDLIIIAGKNYYPQDIETVMEQAHEQVRPGCSVAISVELEDTESLVLLVELRERDKEYSFQTLQEIAQAITSHLFENCGLVPAKIVLLPAKTLDKTTSGKVRRQPNKTRYLEGEFMSFVLYQQDNACKGPSISVIETFPMRTAIETGLLDIFKMQLSSEHLTLISKIDTESILTQENFPVLSEQIRVFIENKAIEFNYQECLTKKLEMDDVFSKNNLADMVMYICCFFEMHTNIGKNVIFSAINNNNEELLAKLIKANRDVNTLGLHGKTALHLAVQLNRPNMISLLMLYHANPNQPTELGITPLDLAQFSQQSELIDALFKTGNVTNNSSFSAGSVWAGIFNVDSDKVSGSPSMNHSI